MIGYDHDKLPAHTYVDKLGRSRTNMKELRSNLRGTADCILPTHSITQTHVIIVIKFRTKTRDICQILEHIATPCAVFVPSGRITQ